MLNITPKRGFNLIYGLSGKNYRVLSCSSDEFGIRWFRVRNDKKDSILVPDTEVFVSQWRFD